MNFKNVKGPYNWENNITSSREIEILTTEF